MKVLSLLLVLLLAVAITTAEAKQSRKFTKLTDENSMEHLMRGAEDSLMPLLRKIDQNSMEHLMRGAEDSLMPLLRKIECQDDNCAGIKRRCLNKKKSEKTWGKRGKWERCIRTIVKCLTNLKTCHESKLNTLDQQLDATVSGLYRICNMFCLNGSCNNDFKCECKEGFDGFACNKAICDPACINSTCADGKCECFAGYEGDDCGTAICDPACIKGTCTDGKCECNAGYEGDDCGTVYIAYPGGLVWSPEQCGQMVGGIVGGAFKGDNSSACMEECSGQDDCTAFLYTEEYRFCYMYNCPLPVPEPNSTENNYGFLAYGIGPAICDPECINGTCVDNKCECNAGYEGDDCGTAICDPECENGGTCTDGKCECNSGYEGDDCGTAICDPKCKKNGTCVDGKCECNSGYEGDDCGTAICIPECINGTCVDLKCECNEGYKGVNCGADTSSFSCRNFFHISKTTVCDGIDDCSDNSDEESCVYKAYPGGVVWRPEQCGQFDGSFESTNFSACKEECTRRDDCTAFLFTETYDYCRWYNCPLPIPEPDGTDNNYSFAAYGIGPADTCAADVNSACSSQGGFMNCRDECETGESDVTNQGDKYSCFVGGCKCCYNPGA